MLEHAKHKSPLTAPLKVLFVLGVAALFFVLGYTVAVVDAHGGGSGLVLGKYQNPPKSAKADVDFNMFWDVWRTVEQQYVDQPVDDQKLYYGALQGLVWGLGDPYSTFFTPDQAKEFSEELAGSFFGIGAEIGLDDKGAVVVIAPLPGTPADKKGLKAEDHILAIDGKDTSGMSVNEAVDLIRGDKGTTVTLTILRTGTAEPFEVLIQRDEISVDSVTWKVRDDGIGVINITMFNEDTVSLFAKAVKEVLDAHCKGLIIDMRNNPGGFLDSATTIAGYWVNGQTAVMEEVRGDRTELPADGPNTLADMPTVVLVNGGSASAAEILSGALQDYNKAELIGEKTFGKGSVQEYHDLPDGSAVKITVARWLTPLGRSIDKQGITPDQVIAPSDNAAQDPQFDAALDFLKTK